MGRVVKSSQVRPMTLGKFTLTGDGLEVNGKPTFEEWLGVGDFIRQAHQAAGWWMADWIAFGESQEGWRERLEQVVDADLLTESSAKQYRYIAQQFPRDRRVENLSFSHHVVMAQTGAALSPKKQDQLLEEAKTEGWSTRDLRRHVRNARRRKVLDGQATLAGVYRVLYVTPPWGDMSVEELAALPVQQHSAQDAALFLWAPPSLLAHALEVVKCWGFTYKTNAVWDRVLPSSGKFLLMRHEHLVIATRGDCDPDVLDPKIFSLFVERRPDGLIQKPPSVRSNCIERLYTRGPYLELFGLEKVEGWSAFGSDPSLWWRDAERELTCALEAGEDNDR